MAPTVKAQPTTPQRLPRGCGMTKWADQFFVQQQLREMNFDELAFAHHPALLGTRPETPENKRFNSTCMRMPKKMRAMPQACSGCRA